MSGHRRARPQMLRDGLRPGRASWSNAYPVWPRKPFLTTFLMRIGLLPFIEIRLRSAPLLLLLGISLPGLICLLGRLPIRALARIIDRRLFAHDHSLELGS